MMMKPLSDKAFAGPRAIALAAMAAWLLGACASPQHKAPVEDRGVRPATAMAAAQAPGSDAPKVLPGAENAGKPGYYSVRPGDTLMRVGLETGQNWRDIARWNNIDNPNLLEVGQVLRVVAPGTDTSATTARAVPPAKVEARPLDGSASAAAAASSPVAAPAASSAAAVPRDEDVAWAWPTAVNITTPFDEARSKGLVFAGKAGDPVLAAGDGRVIYVGSGVRGYGNLVIVKHNNTYLTAYAHNQTLLVKEDQVVRRGQKIAEMGSSDAERVQLHFEIRKLGKPVDPARLLPPR
ncbi:MAG: peptidoglycan DD-metalloendopeptidase family protein [Burkholderiaceae bacterium]|nr:peptidoglycan DD-metalloendopeptidase family protein [Burkholderiaceae bacterium]